MNIRQETVLTPAQKRAFEGLLGGLTAGDVLVLRGPAGSGKTTVLESVQAAAGGVLIGMRQFMCSLAAHPPAAIEEAFLRMLEQALAAHDLILVDDLSLVTRVVNGDEYPRAFLLDAALTALLGEAAALKRKLVFASEGEAPWPIQRRAYSWDIGDFAPEDYARLCGTFLDGKPAVQLDYARIHRFAPALTPQQLRNVCQWLGRQERLDTESFIQYLRSQDMTSNVELEEVQRVDWSDLKGVDEVIQELEAKIALPFENDALSAELGLKPKRGVLLAGPPGTGKTTIGRALAHRLKSKFFRIDGRSSSCELGRVFEAARRNAPAVVFIDDADVLLQDDGNRWFYRYLLTLLDGLESASAERVCVMMTAMSASDLPAPILRSGRVELWLETRLPDADARAAILRERLAALPAAIGGAGVPALAAASEGLTGADLKNVVEDAKLLFAHDRATGKELRPAEEYFLEAIEGVRANRRKYRQGKAASQLGFCGAGH